MNLPFRKRGGADTKPVIPEMNGPTIQTTEQSAIRWPRLALAAILAVVILAGLVAGGRWTYNKVAHHTPQTVATTKQAPAKPKPAPATTTAPSTPTASQPSVSSSSTVQTAPAATQPQTATAAQGNLSNTGPGDTAALFLFVSALGAVGYHFVLRRSTE